MSPPRDVEADAPSKSASTPLSRVARLLRLGVNGTPIVEIGSSVKDAPKYSDSENDEACEKLWSIYAAEAERYDATLVESWRGDMEGMLIFSGLFSASVTGFLIESYHSLTPDSGDMTVQLLTRLSQQIAGEVITTPLSSPFHIPTWSIVCNTLWFTSLTLSLACALLATLVEQWAREFLHKTGRRPSPVGPVRRARVLAFLYFGVQRFGMPAIVEVLPMLIHLALLLFFAGLVVFLVPVNQVVMILVAALSATFVSLYMALTLLPTIALDCPYRTPLSGLAWNLLERLRTFPLGSALGGSVATLTQVVIKHAFDQPKYRDERAILWTVENLTDDNELLPFVEAIPDVIFGPKGFRQVNDHLFGSVLSATNEHISLGHRIFNLLRDAEHLADTDPTKVRKQMSSLRAIWALCTVASQLPSSRRGEAFLTWLTETNAFLSDTVVESMRSYVEAIHQLLDEVACNGRARWTVLDVRGLTAALEKPLPEPTVDPVAQHILFTLQGVRDLFRRTGRTLNVSDAVAVTTVIRDDPAWVITKIRNTSRMLQDSFNSGTIPYNLEMTSHHIFPELHSPEWTTIRQALLAHSRLADHPQLANIAVWVISPAYQSEQSPWRYQIASRSPTHLDYMMRMVIRLLPCLRADSTLPFVYWYFANRTSIPENFQDSFHPNTTALQPFLGPADKVFIETKFIESMRSVETPPRTLEAVAAYYMQDLNSEQTIDQMYLTTMDIVESPLSASQSRSREPRTWSSIHMSVKTILIRTLWGHLQKRLHKISADSAHTGRVREMDEDTGIDLSKIVQHPFLVNHEPDIDEKTNVKVACSRIQQRLDEAYTAALDEIAGFCKGDGGRASLLIPALRAMCTFPEHASLSTENQQPFIKNLLNIMATIKQTPLEFGLYRSAVLSLLPPIIDWFTSLSNWADDSENFQHTAILVETLEIYAYEHGGRQDRRAFRTVELREHFALLLWRLRHPDWAESRQMGSLVGIPSIIAPPEADVLAMAESNRNFPVIPDLHE
ncbi:hypothetical protein B0H13DRAFT_2499095 [Mycena leptocephala]|nr:hypothetical protein B0H13DRAFT_2499095 [Mycena leptocephala]